MAILARIIALALVVGFGPESTLAAEEFNLWLGGSVRQGLFKDKDASFTEKTGFKIVLPGDPEKYNAVLMLQDVLQGKAEGAATSTTFEDWRATAKKNLKVTDDELAKLTYRVIGNDQMEILSNKDNGAKSLNRDQLARVLTGKVKKWKEVGGKDIAVVLILPNKPPTNEFVRKRVMNGEPFGPHGDMITSYENYVNKIENTPGAIGFAPSGSAKGTIVKIDTPVIGRPITLITLGKPSPRVQAFIDFVAKGGK